MWTKRKMEDNACHALAMKRACVCVCQRDLRNYYYWFLSLRCGNVTRWLQDDRRTNLPFVHWLKEVNSCKFIHISFNMIGSINLCFRKLTHLFVINYFVIIYIVLLSFLFDYRTLSQILPMSCQSNVCILLQKFPRCSAMCRVPTRSIQITATIQ